MAFCTRCGRDNDGDARFCAGCGTPLARVARREERKVVTVVFVDVVGSTARAARLDPEDVRAMLAPFQERTRQELERHGGTVEKYIGDAVFAVFGAPTAHDDDPERAVRAGLAVLESVAQLNEEDPALALEVRVGVNTGEALVSLGARPEHGETMVSGDVVNTGARLQAAAPVGAVLVGEQTYHATERVIEYREALPIDAKGKDEPVVAWVAVAPHARFGVDLSGPGRAPLVGRTEELGALRAALQRVRTAQAPHLVTLVGVPGIGKTRLVHELSRIVDDDEELIVWRQGRSLSYGGGVSYWALGEMVKAQAGILESDSADEAAAKLERATLDLLDDDAERAWVERHLRPLVGLAGGERDESADESDGRVAAVLRGARRAERRSSSSTTSTGPTTGCSTSSTGSSTRSPVFPCSSCAPHDPSCSSGGRAGEEASGTPRPSRCPRSRTRRPACCSHRSSREMRCPGPDW